MSNTNKSSKPRRPVARTQAQQIARHCIQEARDMLGPGWGHVSDEIRWGLVMARVVGVIRIQDESTSPATVLAYFNALVDACRDQLDGARIGPV